MAPLVQHMVLVSREVQALATSTPVAHRNPPASIPNMALEDTPERQRIATNLTRATTSMDQDPLGEPDLVIRPAGVWLEIRPLAGIPILLGIQIRILATKNTEVVLQEELGSGTKHPVVAAMMIITMRKAVVSESTFIR